MAYLMHPSLSIAPRLSFTRAHPSRLPSPAAQQEKPFALLIFTFMALTVITGLLKSIHSPATTTPLTLSSRVTSTSPNTLLIVPQTTTITPLWLPLLSNVLLQSTSFRNSIKSITPSIATTPALTQSSRLGLIASIIILIMPQ